MPSGFGSRVRIIQQPGIPSWILNSSVMSVRADVYQVTGSGVSTWTDQSGDGNSPTQIGDDAKRPLVDTSEINGHPALDCAGTRYFDWTPSGQISALTAAEVFAVGKCRNDPGAVGLDGLWDFGASGDLTHFTLAGGGAGSIVYDDFATTVRKSTNYNPSPQLTSPWIWNVISTSSEWTAIHNGVQAFTTATNTVGWSAQLRLGASGAGSRILDGWLAEVHLFPAKLTTQERADVMSYLQNRYGI
jgi:hypothetical protein